MIKIIDEGNIIKILRGEQVCICFLSDADEFRMAVMEYVVRRANISGPMYTFSEIEVALEKLQEKYFWHKLERREE